MAQKLTKLEAAARFEVSQSTIDRMIQRGDLQVQKERHGNRHRIWVVLDESREASTGVFYSSPNESGHSPPERVDMSETLELTVLRERVKNLEELVEHHRGLLKDSEWRYQQLFGATEQQPAHCGIPHQGPARRGQRDFKPASALVAVRGRVRAERQAG